MKKWLMMGLGICLCFSLAGCSKAKEESSYDEDKVLAKSEEIIQLIHEEKYEDVLNDALDKVKEQISVEQLKEAVDSIGEKGAFVAFKDHEMVVQSNIAIMGIIAEYEHMTIQYTVSLDQDLKLAGFYLKPIA